MIRALSRAGIGILLLVPALALASNDVTLDSNTVINSGGVNLTVSGASLDTIAVDSSTFTVTLSSGGNINVTSADKRTLSMSTDVQYITSSFVCGPSNSTLAISSSKATPVTVTVTVGAACNNSGGGGGGIMSGGSGGGSVGIVATPITFPTTTTMPAINTPNVPVYTPPEVVMTFKKNLTAGSVSADVKNLQVYLNTRGFTVAKMGAGSPGKETKTFGPATRVALIKFQKSVGIIPASGYFGPVTRAYVTAHQ